MNNTAPTFAKQDSLKFFRTLNSRVNSYFKENNIQKTGNWTIPKNNNSLFRFLAPYFLILTLGMPFWAHSIDDCHGIGMAGVNVMHDGNHGLSYNKSWVNKFMGGTIYVLGNVYNWQVQHNVSPPTPTFLVTMKT
jgi:linoleoyl-CoA desaturase